MSIEVGSSWRKAWTWPWSAHENKGKEWDTHEWKRKIGVGHMGEERGCGEKRKIRRLGNTCVLILTFTVLQTRFPFWKDKKGENQVEKWLTFLLRYKFVVVKWHFHAEEHKTRPPVFLEACFSPSGTSNWEGDGMRTHQERCHLTLHSSVFMHHFCSDSCLVQSTTLIFVWFQHLQQQYGQSGGEITSRRSDGKTGPCGDCLPFQHGCVLSVVIYDSQMC